MICSRCGCTDDDCSGCVEATGAPCWWVEDDLCSRCFNETRPAAALMVAGALLVFGVGLGAFAWILL